MLTTFQHPSPSSPNPSRLTSHKSVPRYLVLPLRNSTTNPQDSYPGAASAADTTSIAFIRGIAMSIQSIATYTAALRRVTMKT